MTITPTELQLMSDAERLLDAVERAIPIRLTSTQRGFALIAVEIELRELRRRYRAEMFDELLCPCGVPVEQCPDPSCWRR
jgi:hypothetical protein